jgi:c-di-GMP-binding flagellar brake protein YcgR
MSQHSSTEQPVEQRRYPRKAVTPGYSVVQVRRAGRSQYDLTGHVYDLSLGGMRFELDKALGEGEAVDVRVTLPGEPAGRFEARGVMVRYHDDPGEAGPVRMGLAFDELATEADRHVLARFMGNGTDNLRPAG